jgi:hypothetical protein
MFQGDTWIFAGPDPAVVGIDPATDMKHTLITELRSPEISHGLVSPETFVYRIPNEQSYLHP